MIQEKDKEKRNKNTSVEKKVVMKRTVRDLRWYGGKILTLTSDK